MELFQTNDLTVYGKVWQRNVECSHADLIIGMTSYGVYLSVSASVTQCGVSVRAEQ